uniref:G protein-coupled receptor n=1 Tax=Globodera pallida TaxID=36090 RepID=A0A183BJ33_GLOPA
MAVDELNFVLAVLELLINLASIPASALNSFLVARTQLIHRNMKFILVYQSAFLIVRSVGRSIICLGKLTIDPINAEHSEPTRTIFSLGVYNRNFLAHVLIIERIMATVWLSTYEKQKSWLFSLLWSPLVFFAALFNIIMMGNSTSTLFNIVSNSSILIIGMLEFLRIYIGGFPNRAPSLSEKYQLSENIRIGRQLTPALICHFLCLSMNVLKLYWSQFEVPGYDYLLPVTTLLGSFFGLLIETTTIQFHPFLKRRFCQMLGRIFDCFCIQQLRRSNRVSPAFAQGPDQRMGQQNANNRHGSSIALQDIISGAVMPTSMQPDRHFAILQKTWNAGPIPK